MPVVNDSEIGGLGARILRAPVAKCIFMSFDKLRQSSMMLVETGTGTALPIAERTGLTTFWGRAGIVTTICDGVATLLVGQDAHVSATESRSLNELSANEHS